MMNIGKKSVSLALAACLACGVALTSAFAETGEAAAATDYYAPITATGGDALLGQVHDLITKTHTHYSSYEDCRDYAEETDPALDGGSGIVEFYTHETITTYLGSTSDSGKWNREHVWPQSLSNGKWGKNGAGSDLHHIRPSEKEMNGTRGNDLFGEVTHGSPVYSQKLGGGNSKLGGYHAGGVFEPLDNVKGDAARIVLYVYTHYNTYSNVHGTTNGNGSSGYFGTLPITNIISASSEKAAFDLLVEWNKLDPVDSIETKRNEVVYGIQDNRNPFIDHPEYVNAIWGDGTVDPEPDPDPNPVDPDPVTPTGNKFTITLDSFTLQSSDYGFHPWTANGVSGTAYIFGGNTDGALQFNKKKDSYYLASTTATPGAIRSVTVKLQAGATERPWKLLTSDSAYGEVKEKPTNGTDHGVETVTADGVTWQVTGDDTYFALTYEFALEKGACYLDSIVIEYEKTETPDPGTQGGTTDPGTQGGTTDPGTTDGTQEPETSSGGCGGVIGGAGALLAVVAAAAVVLRRRKL